VLLVTNHLLPGGLERVVVDLATALHAEGFPVGVSAAGGGAFWNELPHGVARHELGGSPTLRSLRRLLASGRYAVVHTHQRKVSALARIAAAGTGVRVIEHVHNVFPAGPLARLLSFRTPVLIACGTAVRRMLLDEFGRRPDRVLTVLNGIHDPLEGPVPPLPSSSGDGAVRLVGVGRLAAQKDPVRFVRLVAALRTMVPVPLHAVWVGAGELTGDVRAEIDRLGLGDVVELAGHQHDVRPFLADADALLLTSRWEGLPLAALEALAMGRGLLLPDVGSCADALGDAAVGLVYDPSLPDETVAHQIAGALTPDVLALWSRSARRRFEERFRFDRAFRQLLPLYEAAGARRAAAPDGDPEPAWSVA
jgi:glycosyltransferase involved in cell wall biosynthesis